MELKGASGFAAWQTYLNIAFYIPFSKVIRDADNITLAAEIEENGEKFTRDQWGKDEAVLWMDDQTEEIRARVFCDCLAQVMLDEEDFMRLVCIHKDKNGIQISRHSARHIEFKVASVMVMHTLESCYQASKGSLFF